jgi:hypothetical protein
LNNLLLRATLLDSAPTSQILRYSPEVAIKSGLEPDCKGKRLSAYWVWNPHDFGRGVLMLENCAFLEFALVVVELDDLDLVLRIFDERTQS